MRYTNPCTRSLNHYCLAFEISTTAQRPSFLTHPVYERARWRAGVVVDSGSRSSRRRRRSFEHVVETAAADAQVRPVPQPRRRVVSEGTQAPVSLEGLPVCELPAGRRTTAGHGCPGRAQTVSSLISRALSLSGNPSVNKHVGPPCSRTRNLRGPHVARRQQLSVDICCPRPTSAANPPAAAAAVSRRDRRTDGQKDTRAFYDAYRILRGPRKKWRNVRRSLETAGAPTVCRGRCT